MNSSTDYLKHKQSNSNKNLFLYRWRLVWAGGWNISLTDIGWPTIAQTFVEKKLITSDRIKANKNAFLSWYVIQSQHTSPTDWRHGRWKYLLKPRTSHDRQEKFRCYTHYSRAWHSKEDSVLRTCLKIRTRLKIKTDRTLAVQWRNYTAPVT